MLALTFVGMVIYADLNMQLAERTTSTPSDPLTHF